MDAKCSVEDEASFKFDEKRLVYCSDRYNKIGLGDNASPGER